MAVVKTYLGAVKPVGEKIVLNYVFPASTAVSDSYDFLIDANFCVTGIEITKTGATTNTGAGNILTARVEKVDASNPAVATEIGQAGLSVGTLAIGSKNIAGFPSATVTVAAGAANAANTYLDPTVLVQANSAVAGTVNSRQRIRVTVTSVVAIAGAGATAFTSSCLIEVQLCKYATVTQGVVGATSVGIQAAELLSPPTA